MEILPRGSGNTVPAFKYSFPNHEIDTVVAEFKEMLRSGDFLTSARHTSSFEEAFARLAGTNHAVAVSSGTAALEIILRWVGVEGREVIVPTNTFAATPFAVIHAGGHPVFADCLDDLTIDPEDVARRVTTRTAAVITVHVGGLVSPHTEDLSCRVPSSCRQAIATVITPWCRSAQSWAFRSSRTQHMPTAVPCRVRRQAPSG